MLDANRVVGANKEGERAILACSPLLLMLLVLTPVR